MVAKGKVKYLLEIKRNARGVCNFPSSLLLQQKFEVVDGPVLQLSFIWQAKENTSSRHERGPKREAHSLIFLLILPYISSIFSN